MLQFEKRIFAWGGNTDIQTKTEAETTVAAAEASQVALGHTLLFEKGFYNHCETQFWQQS